MRPALALCAVTLLGALAPGAGAAGEPATAKTYVLTRLAANDALLLEKVLLRNEATGKDVAIRNGGEETQLVEVAPGPHWLRRVDTRYQNMAAIRIPKPAVFFEIEAGKVNYIGDIVAGMFAKPSAELSAQLEWRFVPNSATVREAASHHAEKIAGLPIVFVRQGAAPVPISADGSVSHAP